jgi:hypothetical protein
MATVTAAPMMEEYSSPCATPWPQVNEEDHNASYFFPEHQPTQEQQFGELVAFEDAMLMQFMLVPEIASLLPDIVESKRRTHEELLAADNVLPEKICLTPESYFFPEHQPTQEQQFGELVAFEDAMLMQFMLVPVIASLLPDIIESKRCTHEELLAADNILPEKICLTPESYFFPEHQPAQEQQFGELVAFEDAMLMQFMLVPVEQ